MAEAASAQQAASATAEDTSQQRAGRRRRTSPEPQRAQQGATASPAAAPAALDSLSRLQQLANASPQVAQLQRLQALVDASPQVAQLRRLQALADASPQAAQLRRLQALADAAAGVPSPTAAVEAAPPNRTGLPDGLKAGVESLSGLSMDHVRVHYNSAQPAQLNALAYAQGSDIHLAPGQEQHLPHEAWHVVQQAQGRVKATMQMAGVGVNDDVELEREADAMGARTVQLTRLGCKLQDLAPKATSVEQGVTAPVQRLVVAGDDQENLTIASALPAAVAKAGKPVHDWNAACLHGATCVAIVAHGDINSIELAKKSYNGGELAQELVTKQIQPHSELLLWACRAGMQSRTDKESDEGSSLVEQTAAGLKNRVEGVKVSGFRGVHIFLRGDDNASRIIDPGLTRDHPDVEELWLAAIRRLNMHYVYLSGYFSDPYLAMHMHGWTREDVVVPLGHTRNLWSMDEDDFNTHASLQTRAEFLEKEKQAHASLVAPDWLADQERFNEYKSVLWRAAGMKLIADADFEFATLRESAKNHDAMTRTATS